MTIDRHWLRSDRHYTQKEIDKVREYFENSEVTKQDINRLKSMIYKDMKLASELELQKDFDKKELVKLVSRIKNKDKKSFNLLVKKRIITKEGKLTEPWSGWKWMHIIQVALNLEWYKWQNGNKLKVDGKYWPDTAFALLNYQKKEEKYHNTTLHWKPWEPDGITDGRTIISLLKEESVIEPTEPAISESVEEENQTDKKQCPTPKPEIWAWKQDEKIEKKEPKKNILQFESKWSKASVEEWKAFTYTLKLDEPVKKDTIVRIGINHVTTSEDDLKKKWTINGKLMEVTIPKWKDKVDFTIKTFDDKKVEWNEVFDVQIVWIDNKNVEAYGKFDHQLTTIIDNDKEDKKASYDIPTPFVVDKNFDPSKLDKKEVNETLNKKVSLLKDVMEIWLYNAQQKSDSLNDVAKKALDKKIRYLSNYINKANIETEQDYIKAVNTIFYTMWHWDDRTWWIVDKVDLDYTKKALLSITDDTDFDKLRLKIYNYLRINKWVKDEESWQHIVRMRNDWDYEVIRYELMTDLLKWKYNFVNEIVDKNIDGKFLNELNILNELKKHVKLFDNSNEGRKHISELARRLRFFENYFKSKFFESGSTYTKISNDYEEKLDRYYDEAVTRWKIDPNKLDKDTFKQQAYTNLLRLNARYIILNYLLENVEQRWKENTIQGMYANIIWLAETKWTVSDALVFDDANVDQYDWKLKEKEHIYGLEILYSDEKLSKKKVNSTALEDTNKTVVDTTSTVEDTNNTVDTNNTLEDTNSTVVDTNKTVVDVNDTVVDTNNTKPVEHTYGVYKPLDESHVTHIDKNKTVDLTKVPEGIDWLKDYSDLHIKVDWNDVYQYWEKILTYNLNINDGEFSYKEGSINCIIDKQTVKKLFDALKKMKEDIKYNIYSYNKNGKYYNENEKMNIVSSSTDVKKVLKQIALGKKVVLSNLYNENDVTVISEWFKK